MNFGDTWPTGRQSGGPAAGAPTPVPWPGNPDRPQPCTCETCRRPDSETQPLHQWRPTPAGSAS